MLSYKLLRKKITLYLDTFKVSCFSFILEVVSFALVLSLILCFLVTPGKISRISF